MPELDLLLRIFGEEGSPYVVTVVLIAIAIGIIKRFIIFMPSMDLFYILSANVMAIMLSYMVHTVLVEYYDVGMTEDIKELIRSTVIFIITILVFYGFYINKMLRRLKSLLNMLDFASKENKAHIKVSDRLVDKIDNMMPADISKNDIDEITNLVSSYSFFCIKLFEDHKLFIKYYNHADSGKIVRDVLVSGCEPNTKQIELKRICSNINKKCKQNQHVVRRLFSNNVLLLVYQIFLVVTPFVVMIDAAEFNESIREYFLQFYPVFHATILGILLRADSKNAIEIITEDESSYLFNAYESGDFIVGSTGVTFHEYIPRKDVKRIRVL